jgi:hypothetical protein
MQGDKQSSSGILGFWAAAIFANQTSDRLKFEGRVESIRTWNLEKGTAV